MHDTRAVSIKGAGDYFGVNGQLLEEQYREHLNDFYSWDQLSHSTDWILFQQNIGPNLNIDETSLSHGEFFTVLTNKQAKGKKVINPKSWYPLNLLKTTDRENLDSIKRDGLKRGMPLGKGMN